MPVLRKKDKVKHVAIIGTTSWGTALGIVLARKGFRVSLWARTEEEAKRINKERENAALLPGIRFPPRLNVSSSVEEVLSKSAMVILAVPAQSMRSNVRFIKDHLKDDMLIVSAAKGIEVGTTKRMSQVVAEEIKEDFQNSICAISGPNLSQEIAQGLLATSVIASKDETVVHRAQEMLNAPNFCVFASTDIIGVELGGAFKNIVALGAGMCDGLGYGDNAKAAFISRALVEMSALGISLGAEPLTFAGLAGIGDTIATCYSKLSRNRYVGEELARGKSLAEIVASMQHVAEGIPTTIAVRQLAMELGVEMPITEVVYRVLFESIEPKQAVVELTQHPVAHEMDGINTRRYLPKSP